MFKVVYVLLVESAHTALTMYMVYEPLVVHFGRATILLHVREMLIVHSGNIQNINIYPRGTPSPFVIPIKVVI